MKKLIFFTNCFLFFVVDILIAQTFSQHDFHKESCRTDENHQYMLRTDPAYEKAYLKQSETLNEIIKEKLNNPIDSRLSPPIYTVPIVVHVIHLGEPLGTGSNISDQQIYEAIQGLNERWSNTIGDGLDMEVNFCLAKTDPNGNPTSGINRVNGSSIQSYKNKGIDNDIEDGCVNNQNAVEKLSRWPVLEYYNIWVVHKICSGAAGYAYYPNGYDYDGTVIDAKYMTYNAQTLTHEIGHGFNLRHTFDGDEDGYSCPPNNNCQTQGDQICDTPPHKREDCGSNNPCSSNGTWNNSRYNYMSYSHQCNITRKRFTPDQKTRVRASFEIYPRNQLLDSKNCTSCIMSVAISSSEDATCGKANGSIKINVSNGVGPLSYLWSNGSTSKDLLNIDAGTYTVTVTDQKDCSAITSGSIIQIQQIIIEDYEVVLDSCGPILLAQHRDCYKYTWYKVKYDSDGNIIEQIELDTSLHKNSWLKIEDVKEASNYFAVGRSCNVDCFSSDITIISTRSSVNDGSEDIGCLSLPKKNISVWPSPNGGRLNYRLNGYPNGSYKIIVRNITGITVLSNTIYHTGQSIERSIDMTSYPPGVYTASVTDNTTSYAKFVIIQ